MTSSKYGVLIGILGICLSISAVVAFRNYNPDDWFLLDWFDFSSANKNVESGFSASPPLLLEITERNAIRWLFIVAIFSGVVSSALSIYGATKNEDSLTVAASALFGFGTISIIDQIYGLVVFAIVFIIYRYIQNKKVNN